MSNDAKTTIQRNLEADIVAMANVIVAVSLQGYIVNSSKFCNLDKTIYIRNLLKDYNSFDKDRQKQIDVLYNSL